MALLLIILAGGLLSCFILGFLGKKKLPALVFSGGLLADQLSKYLISHNMELYQSIPILPNIFHLTYTHNTGAAFSILSGKVWLLILVATLALVLIFYLISTLPPKERVLKFSLLVLAAGALGNLLDRIIYGYVIDFFDFRIWPIFNIADCLIVVSIGFIIWQILFTGKLLIAGEKTGEKND